MKKRIEITVETHRLTVIRHPRPAQRVWCVGCAEVVKTLSAEEAAAVAGLNARAIYRQAEAGRFHFTESPAGLLRICLNSFLQAIHEGQEERPREPRDLSLCLRVP